METLINDAFNPSIYANHIPTNTAVRQNKIVTIVALTCCVIVIGIVLYKFNEYKEEKQDNPS